MSVMEPRVVHVQEVATSLVFNIDMANKVFHDLSYLIKYLRSGAEVKRIENEKKLKMQFDEVEERRRNAFLKAQQISADRHAAATILSLLYRVRKANAILVEKRRQFRLEGYLAQTRLVQYTWVPLQRAFREYSTKIWFYRRGVVLNRNNFNNNKNIKNNNVTKKAKRSGRKGISKVDKNVLVTEGDLNIRLTYEIRQRRVVQRQMMFTTLYEKHVQATLMVECNIYHWLHYLQAFLPNKITQLQDLLVHFKHVHERKVASTADAKPLLSVAAFEALERKCRRLSVRADFMHCRLENLETMQWWIFQHLRNCYRRAAANKASYEDSLQRLEWIAAESTSVGRIGYHIEERIKLLTERQNTKTVREWLVRYAKYVALHLASFDVQQQGILIEEIAKSERDIATTLELDNLLQELVLGLHQDNTYYAERVSLDMASALFANPTGNNVDETVVGDDDDDDNDFPSVKTIKDIENIDTINSAKLNNRKLNKNKYKMSETAAEIASDLFLIKQKQLRLQSSVLDALKFGLQQKLNEEDEFNTMNYAFMYDDANSTAEQVADLQYITAVLIDKFGADSAYFKAYCRGDGADGDAQGGTLSVALDVLNTALTGAASAASGVTSSVANSLINAMKYLINPSSFSPSPSSLKVISKPTDNNNTATTVNIPNPNNNVKPKVIPQAKNDANNVDVKLASDIGTGGIVATTAVEGEGEGDSTLNKRKHRHRHKNAHKDRAGEERADIDAAVDASKKTSSFFPSMLSNMFNIFHPSSSSSIAASAVSVSSDATSFSKFKHRHKTKHNKSSKSAAAAAAAVDASDNTSDANAINSTSNSNANTNNNNNITAVGVAEVGPLNASIGASTSSVSKNVISNTSSAIDPVASALVPAPAPVSSKMASKIRQQRAEQEQKQRENRESGTKEENELLSGIDLRVYAIGSGIGPRHIEVKDFTTVYLIQPWLGEEALLDVRIEEDITALEVKLDKANFELSSLFARIQDQENIIRNAREQIKEVSFEIELRRDPPITNANRDDEESLDDERIRQDLLESLGQEIMKKEMEITITEQIKDATSVMEGPLNKRVEELLVEISELRKKLDIRTKERERLSNIFFNAEQDIVKTVLVDAVSKTLFEHNQRILHIKRRILLCEAFGHMSVDVMKQKIAEDDFDLEQREALHIPEGQACMQFKLQQCLHEMKPRVQADMVTAFKQHVQIRQMSHCVDLSVALTVRQHLEEEEAQCVRFAGADSTGGERVYYERAVKEYQAHLLHSRRQKALQKQLRDRKLRMDELRELRLTTIKEKREREAARILQEEADKLAIQEARRKNTKKLTDDAKRNIRAAKDYVRNLRYKIDGAMDPEEARMAARIRANAKEGAAGTQPEGIRKIYFTHGDEETQGFQLQNEMLIEKGLPHYIRMEKSLGEQIYLWFQMTFDPKLFVTHLEIADKIVMHGLSPVISNPDLIANVASKALVIDEKTGNTFIDLKPQKYEAVQHKATNLVLWLKRDQKKTRGLSEIAVSFHELDETRCLVDGFEKIELSLESFKLPGVLFWVKRIDKLGNSNVANTNALISEVVKVRGLVKKAPNDKNLLDLLKKLSTRLQSAYDRDSKGSNANPLQISIDLMALTPLDLEKWMSVYQKIDKDNEERITIEQLFNFFEEIPTEFNLEVFRSVDAINAEDEDTIEFGDFLRAVSTYCFFGKEEIVRFLFLFADTDKVGYLTHEQFVELLNVLHPFDKSKAKRALKEINIAPGQHMMLEEFSQMHGRFPPLFYPAFKLQNSLREKTMGNDWFVEKLRKYKEVRRKVTQNGENTDLLAQLEINRFEEDEERKRRMKEREWLIKQEPSQVKKVLMQARQMMDEFS